MNILKAKISAAGKYLVLLVNRKKYLLTAVFALMIVYMLLIPHDLFRDPLSTVILDKNENLLGARVASDGQWRFPASNSVPEKVSKATIAFEDRYFYYHPGVNPVSII